MAIEVTIKQGDQAAEARDFLGAISKYSAALQEAPSAFAALIKRAQAYTKLCDYDAAKKDISRAFAVAETRGRMELRAECHFRLGLVHYSEKDYDAALVNLTRAKELHSKEAALDIWIEKARRDASKARAKSVEDNVAAGEAPSTSTSTSTSTSLDTINKHAPLAAKIREEWYQTKDQVMVTIYAKDVAAERVTVEFAPRSMSIAFPTSASSEYSYTLEHLCGAIVPERSSYRVGGKKIELVLAKAEAGKWAALEADAPAEAGAAAGLAYPTSSRKNVDWASFNVKEEDESEDFFEKLYKDVDEDTRRAMMKSYVESNGTVLTTNWAEAKQKTFETSPPEGMEAKKW